VRDCGVDEGGEDVGASDNDEEFEWAGDEDESDPSLSPITRSASTSRSSVSTSIASSPHRVLAIVVVGILLCMVIIIPYLRRY